MKIQTKPFSFAVVSGSMLLGAADLGKVDTKAFHHATGKTLTGVAVHSLHIASDGKAVVLKDTDGTVAGFNANDFEIVALAFIQARGYKLAGGGH